MNMKSIRAANTNMVLGPFYHTKQLVVNKYTIKRSNFTRTVKNLLSFLSRALSLNKVHYEVDGFVVSV